MSADRVSQGGTREASRDDRTSTPDPASSRSAAKDDALRPWHFFVLVSLVAATAAVVMARDARPEHLVLMSITIGAAGFAGAALYRTLAPLVGRDAVSAERLTESMRSVLEREKMLALRAIKELEFDRAMGKVSPRDFEEMAGRLRTRALALMRQLDSEGSAYRELIERDLAARLRKAPLSSPEDASAPGSGAAEEPEAALTPPERGATVTCSCGTANDADAVFCKQCGQKLARAQS